MRDLRSVLGLVDGYVTRFDDSFCPKVVGVDAQLTKMIEARIRANAAVAGLAAAPGCKPTGFAIFIERPREIMRALRERRPDLFGLRGRSGTITAMIRREQPFHPWRAVVERTFDGHPAGGASFAVASRIVPPSRYDVVASSVVIDIARIVGATTTQIADFATMKLLNNTSAVSSGGTARGSILGYSPIPIPLRPRHSSVHSIAVCLPGFTIAGWAISMLPRSVGRSRRGLPKRRRRRANPAPPPHTIRSSRSDTFTVAKPTALSEMP